MSDSLLEDLSPLEHEVVAAARAGTWAGPEDTEDTETLAVTDDPDLRVRAELIRELLTGKHGDLDPRGVRVQGVRIVGELDLDHATAVAGLTLLACAVPDGISCAYARLRRVDLRRSRLSCFIAEGARVDGYLELAGAVVTGGAAEPALSVNGARIGDFANLDNTSITCATGLAFDGEDLKVDGNLTISDATITGAGALGALRLRTADITGHVALSNSVISNRSGPAVVGDDLRVSENLDIADAVITGRGPSGALRLHTATVGGQLDLTRAAVTDTAGPAVNAERLRAGSFVFMKDVSFSGTGPIGALCLTTAEVFGLDLRRAKVASADGTAIAADAVRVADDLNFSGMTAVGSGRAGAVRLSGARVAGRLKLAAATLTNPSGPLVVLTEAQAGGAMVLPLTVVCPESGDARPCPAGDRTVVVRDLTFSQLGDITWREWLHVLVHHTPEYFPQPYQHLAAVERAAGHDTNARRVLIAQQDDLRRRAPKALGGRMARWRHRLWGVVGRYGYQAHRIVTALLLVLVLAGGAGYVAGQVATRPGHHAAERVPPTTAPAGAAGVRCSTAELIGLGIDRGLPLGATGLRARCDLDTSSGEGQVFTYVLWLLQAFIWALATLTVAAYTGLVRKPQ